MSWFIFLMKVHAVRTSPASAWPRVNAGGTEGCEPSSLCLLSVLGSESRDSMLLQKGLRTITTSSWAVFQGLVQGISEVIRHFLVAFTALSPYSIYSVYFCRSALLFLALACLPAVVFMMICYAERCPGLSLSLSQVKVSNKIILERIRQGVNPPLMLLGKKKSKSCWWFSTLNAGINTGS